MAILLSSLMHTMQQLGTDVVQDVVYVTHPLVHAIEQPLAGVWTETKTVVQGTWNMSHSLFRLAAYGTGGWLMWTWAGEYFPRQKRSIEDFFTPSKRNRGY